MAQDGTFDLLTLVRSLRQHQRAGRRSPHKPLLVLLSLGRLTTTGSSAVPWSVAEQHLADLLADFGPPSRAGRSQSVAYPFTRLRNDGLWELDADVPMDRVTGLAPVVGRLPSAVETLLTADQDLVAAVARELVTSNFPGTMAPDVLLSVGLDPDWVLHDAPGVPATAVRPGRRRDPAWRAAVLQVWDRQCAFCAFDGTIGGAVAALEAAHVRWFSFDGPDDLDNGLALCVLHHKLFDLGAIGLDDDLHLVVAPSFSARTESGRRVYDLHGRALVPRRRGAVAPAAVHVRWHRTEVFHGAARLAS